MFTQNNTKKPGSPYLEKIRHYLPAQAPLKDFIHHNSLHAFQEYEFYSALKKASDIFGYKLFLSLDEYRAFYQSGRIKPEILKQKLIEKWGTTNWEHNLNKLLTKNYNTNITHRIGALREEWRNELHIDLDNTIHPLLFRIIGGYLDQGISAWAFPYNEEGLIASLRDIEHESLSSFFNNKKTKELLLDTKVGLEELLKLIVGDDKLYERYLFDQQFGHQGWSGLVNILEHKPDTLYDQRNVCLEDFVHLELLLEFDFLTSLFGDKWKPLCHYINKPVDDLFADVKHTELDDVFEIWQNAFEWSYYDEVLRGIITQRPKAKPIEKKSFQALFCIDDREGSLRRYIEHIDTNSETFGTAGFFNVEFFYKPANGKFLTKLCPAPVTPKHLVKEVSKLSRKEKEFHFSSQSHGIFNGWIIAQTLGFWSAIKLFANIFKPSLSPAVATSLKHMDKDSKLIITNTSPEEKENGLQLGFTHIEMADRIEGLLKSIGLTENFASIIYVVGHGSSSVNNPHYSAYDCGACSGRPGSVNARVVSNMANKPEVRQILRERGIDIPDTTQFIGALHDTTRDEIVFYDEKTLSEQNYIKHLAYIETFNTALMLNAKERSRRFSTVNTKEEAEKVWEKVKRRSVTIFEPRPELNHATNALCVVGSRDFTKDLFLDRRSFFNSYNYKIDPNGDYLYGILKAVAPVCGGINLEYYFSRVDNEKLGAGSKLPHNVIGLIAVANGTDGDLRPGLPSQMIEIHHPIRLLVIVEQHPEIVLQVIQRDEATYEWFKNMWIHLTCVCPTTNRLYYFKNEKFVEYIPTTKSVTETSNLVEIIENNEDYLPVMIIKD